MENVTTGHWVFAGIFLLLFVGFLVWSYRKDLGMHRTYYRGSSYVLITLLVLLFLWYIFKRLL